MEHGDGSTVLDDRLDRFNLLERHAVRQQKTDALHFVCGCTRSRPGPGCVAVWARPPPLQSAHAGCDGQRPSWDWQCFDFIGMSIDFHLAESGARAST